MNNVIRYFTGEKDESYIFLTLGIIGLIMAVYFLFALKSSFWRGIAIPFILVSMLEIVVGVTLIFRTPKDIIRVEHYVNNEPEKIKTDEIPRMNQVMKNFVIFRYSEIVLIITGLILYFACSGFDFWKGLGIGLSIQASIVLLLDFFAERRGAVYLEYLKTLVNG